MDKKTRTGLLDKKVRWSAETEAPQHTNQQRSEMPDHVRSIFTHLSGGMGRELGYTKERGAAD